MLKKYETIQKVKNDKIIMILRSNDDEEAEKVVDYAVEGGIRQVEITMTTPGALRCVERLTKKYGAESGVTIGVGTVLDDITARMAILSGAQFVVSPHLDLKVIEVCNRYSIPAFPGAITIKDVVSALEAGADVIKFFPSEVFGPKIIKEIKGPIPNANIIPTSGIRLDNCREWIDAGALAVGVGRDIAAEGILTGNYKLISEKAKQYIDKVNER